MVTNMNKSINDQSALLSEDLTKHTFKVVDGHHAILESFIDSTISEIRNISFIYH